MSAQFEIFSDLDVLSVAVMGCVAARIEELTEQRDRVSLVLAGGSTPKALYVLLALNFGGKLDWSKVHLFWGDERCVPLDTPESNFHMAYQTLISKIDVPEENLHIPPTNLGRAEEIARAYEQDLRDFFDLNDSNEMPVFDIVLLGMGSDGHTASLFPNGAELEEHERLVTAVSASPTPPHVPRISLTVSVLQAAEQVHFLVAGASKQPVMDAIMNDPEEAKLRYPAALVGLNDNATWYVDAAAVSGINS